MDLITLAMAMQQTGSGADIAEIQRMLAPYATKAALSAALTGKADVSALASYATISAVTQLIASSIAQIERFEYYLCEEGEYDPQTEEPTVVNPDLNHIYLVPTSGAKKLMYAYIDSNFVPLGDTELDLSGYVTVAELTAALATKADAADVKEDFVVTGDFTNFTEFSNANHNAKEIYEAKQAGKEIKGQFLFGVPFLGPMPLELRLISCGAGETEMDDPPIPLWIAMFGGFIPWGDLSGNGNYKYLVLTLNYQNNTAMADVKIYEIAQPGQIVPSAANEANGKVPVTENGEWVLGTLHKVGRTGSYTDLSDTPNLATVATSGAYSDLSGKPNLASVAESGSYNDLSNKPTIPTVPSNIVTGSAKSYTIVVSNSPPATGTADNIITIVVPQ